MKYKLLTLLLIIVFVLCAYPCWAEPNMRWDNPYLQYSQYCKIHNDIAYISITGSSPRLARYLWQDVKLLSDSNITEVVIFMLNPGGSVFGGTAIVDQIRAMKKTGITVKMEGYGLIASAAIPAYVSAEYRIASKHSIFLIHPAAIEKWGLFRENLQDLKSQQKMLELSRQKYAQIIANNSDLSIKKIKELLKKDNWFTAQQAKEWGLVDEIR